MGINHLHLILILIIGIAYPIYAIFTGKSTRQFLLETPSKKIYAYKQTLYYQLILSFMIFFIMAINHNSILNIGLSFIKQPILVLLLFISCAIIFWIINRIKIDRLKAEKFLSESKDVLYILPLTQAEYRWTIFLSIIAGTLEEIIFRGYLFWQMENYVHFIVALIITNIIFGLSHYGTKLKNALSAFILGTIFSACYLVTDSLWLAILLHISVDLYSATLAFKSSKFVG